VDSSAYYFIATDGRRGDIIRCRTFQPEIQDPDDYFFYMWTESIQGHFVLKQRFVGGQGQEWFLIGEVEVDQVGPLAFEELSETIRQRLQSGDLA
jgi:hypothetical protein